MSIASTSPARRFTEIAVALVLALVLLSAGLAHVRDPLGAASLITGYRILPVSLGGAAGMALGWTEIIVSFSLLCGPLRSAGAIAAASLFAIFGAAQVAVLARGMTIDCGCFGAGGQQVGAITLARTGVLLAGALVVLRLTTMRNRGRGHEGSRMQCVA